MEGRSVSRKQASKKGMYKETRKSYSDCSALFLTRNINVSALVLHFTIAPQVVAIRGMWVRGTQDVSFIYKSKCVSYL